MNAGKKPPAAFYFFLLEYDILPYPHQPFFYLEHFEPLPLHRDGRHGGPCVSMHRDGSCFHEPNKIPWFGACLAKMEGKRPLRLRFRNYRF